MIKAIVIATLFFFLEGLNNFAACSDDNPDSVRWTMPSGKELAGQLIDIGDEIADMIINGDALGLLKFVDKGHWQVSYGGDLYRNYDEVKGDLSDTTSNLYCRLFNNSCYPWGAKKSISEYLKNAKSKNLKTRTGMTYDHKLNLVYGTVFYEWDGIKEELGYSWVVEIPNPEFVYTKNGWKITSIFTE